MKILCIILVIALCIENIIMYSMLKGAEKVVNVCAKQYGEYSELAKNVEEYYELCMKSNKEVDEHYETVKSIMTAIANNATNKEEI